MRIVAALTLTIAVLSQAAFAQGSGPHRSFGAALNAVRAEAGLQGVAPDPRLSAAAQAYAEDMARTGHVRHVGLDGSTHLTRARASGCRTRLLGENIAWGQRSAHAAFDGWMASRGHRANMLGRGFRAFGLGEAQGMWVVMFSDGC